MQFFDSELGSQKGITKRNKNIGTRASFYKWLSNVWLIIYTSKFFISWRKKSLNPRRMWIQAWEQMCAGSTFGQKLRQILLCFVICLCHSSNLHFIYYVVLEVVWMNLDAPNTDSPQCLTIGTCVLDLSWFMGCFQTRYLWRYLKDSIHIFRFMLYFLKQGPSTAVIRHLLFVILD